MRDSMARMDDACQRGVRAVARMVGGFATRRDVARYTPDVESALENTVYGSPSYDLCRSVMILMMVAARDPEDLDCIEMQHAARALVHGRIKMKTENYAMAKRMMAGERKALSREVADAILTLPLYDPVRA